MPSTEPARGFELADVRKFGNRVVRRFVAQARADDHPSLARIIVDHLQVPTNDLPIVEERWAPYEHVNVQAALNAWAAAPEREVEIIGLTNFRHRGPFGLAELVSPNELGFEMHGPRPGNLSRVARSIGPNGETLECIRAAVILVSEGADRTVLLYRGSDPESDLARVTIEAVANRAEAASAAVAELRSLSHEHNIYRGQVVSFGGDLFDGRGSLLRIHSRQRLSADQLILPAEAFADIERQVVGSRDITPGSAPPANSVTLSCNPNSPR